MSETYELDSVTQVRNNLLQLTISILRDWVLNRQEHFSIIDIYQDPAISEKLCLDHEMIKVIRSALLKLNCTVKNEYELLKDEYLFDTYYPPRVVRIDRDLLVS